MYRPSREPSKMISAIRGKSFPMEYVSSVVRRAELVKIDLLIKVQVSFGPLTCSGKACVINSGTVGVPCCAAARRRILDMGDSIRQRLASSSLVKVKRAVFTSTFGKRHRDIFAIQ